MPWEPKTNIGASLVNAPGALSWNELHTPDIEAATAFYGELFGWKTEQFPGAEMPYLIIKNADGHTNGSITSMLPPGTPPHWLVYFGADSADAASDKVTQLGGKRLMEPMDIGPNGRIAVVQDPQGAAFAIYSGQFED